MQQYQAPRHPRTERPVVRLTLKETGSQTRHTVTVLSTWSEAQRLTVLSVAEMSHAKDELLDFSQRIAKFMNCELLSVDLIGTTTQEINP